MYNCLFDEIPTVNVKKIHQNEDINIMVNNDLITSETLFEIFKKVKAYIRRYGLLKKNIIFHFGDAIFKDKITYLMLDMLMYFIYMKTQFNIQLDLRIEHFTIHNGMKNTSIHRTYHECGGRLDRDVFIKNYEKNLYTRVNEDYALYRKMIKQEELSSNVQLLSLVETELETTLRAKIDDSDWVDDVCSVVGELIDNIKSHANSDCLLDIDVCYTDHRKKIIVNIAVINISNIKIYDRVKEKVKNNTYQHTDKLYKKIYKAYDNHKEYFDDNYTEDDFFNVLTFQNGVTSRYDVSGNSGTGLITMIKNIIGKTYAQESYVLSGKNILFFDEDILENIEEDDEFIGFNENNDFLSERPAESIINKSALFIPGTIFNIKLMRENNETKD